jgi:hypothetical protein
MVQVDFERVSILGVVKGIPLGTVGKDRLLWTCNVDKKAG